VIRSLGLSPVSSLHLCGPSVGSRFGVRDAVGAFGPFWGPGFLPVDKWNRGSWIDSPSINKGTYARYKIARVDWVPDVGEATMRFRRWGEFCRPADSRSARLQAPLTVTAKIRTSSGGSCHRKYAKSLAGEALRETTSPESAEG